MATIPTDPLFSSQFHLRNLTAGQFDLNVINVWDDYTGAGVQVNVMDDGFDYFHDDLDGNYLTGIDYDYTGNDFSPLPGGNHGTAVMGIIGAEQGNSYGGVGVAWDVDLVGYRGFSIGASVAGEQFRDAAGLGDGVGNTNGDGNGSDIINMSGGRGSNVFADGAGYDGALSALAEIHADGRGGLGTIFVKSSGNSRGAANSTSREEGTAERYDSTEYSINVAAVRADGWVTDFSTPGANVLVSAFADNTSNNPGIVTTDRSGAPGYNGTDFTTSFGGTSAAAPQVAGVIALMLEANDDLGWRDVQNILAYSARHVGSNVGSNANTGAPSGGGFEQATVSGDSWFWNDANDWNGGGLHFSNDYGFGLVDALAAVRLAEVWTSIETAQTSANDIVANQDMDGSFVTTSYSTSFVSHTATETTNMEIEFVTLNLNFDIDDLADMEIFIVSPTGTRVQMLNDTGDTQALDTDWDFMTNAFRGEESAGSWTVQIRNDDGSSNGTLVTTDVDLQFKGSSITSNDHYIFTNEYSDYDGVAGHTTVFAGGSGIDTLNAAAVTSSTTINLLTNTGTIDGVAITNSNIERVFTGDGNDTITGDGISTLLSGGRGNDTITGGTSIETIQGGAGNDLIFGSGNGDNLQGGDGFDTFAYDPAVTVTDTINGGASNDKIRIDDTGTANFTGATIRSIEEVEFLAGSGSGGAGTTRTAIFDTQQVGNTGFLGLFPQLSTSLRLDGNDGGSTDIVRFNLTADTTFSAANFTFSGSFANNSDGDYLYIVGDGSNETITGSSRADSIQGGSGQDVINGGDGDDTLQGGSGNDTVNAGNGDDLILISGNFIDSVNGGAGSDTLDMSGTISSAVTLNGLTGTNTYSGIGGTQSISGIETFIGTQADDNLTTGNIANTTIDGQGGDDMIRGGGGFQSLSGGDGNDTIDGGFYVGSAVGDNIDGGAGNDSLIGANGADTFAGGTGNDTIEGHGGVDTINAGSGNDTIILTDGDSIDSVDGSVGTDTLDASDVMTGMTINLLTQSYTGVGGTQDINSIENVVGTQGNDFITGGNTVNILDGQDGNDTIRGGFSEDSIFGGTGNDVIIVTGTEFVDNVLGGSGLDTLDHSGLTATGVNGFFDDEINFATGIITSSRTSGGTAAVSGIETYRDNDGGNTIIDQIGALTIFANGGNDTIIESTGGGTDSFYLGSGDDTLEINNLGIGGDTFDGGTGIDLVDFSNVTFSGGDPVIIRLGVGTITQGTNVETLTNFENANGSNGYEIIIGGSETNVINGNGGDDDLRGGAGNDTVNGGSGNDLIYGGAGADSLIGGSGIDTATYNEGAAGTSGIRADLQFSVNNNGIAIGDTYSSIENLTGTNFDDDLRGDAGNNTITGQNGNDALRGRDGDDTLIGANGDDILFGGAGADFLSGGAGRDVANYSDSASGLLVDLTNIGFNTGIAAGDSYAGIEVVVGSGSADDLRGDASDNQLEGRNGDDYLVGRAGDDDLRGGNGNDIILGGAGADRHDGGAGTDTANYADSATGMVIDLASNGLNTGIAAGDGYISIENVIGSGGNDDMRGNNDANRIEGRNGNDFLLGRAGDDTLVGGNGNDNMRGGSGGDVLNGGAGIDSANYIDSAGLRADLQNAAVNTGVAAGDTYLSVENLFGSNGGDDLRGDTGDNTIIARNGDDYLTGRNGDDELRGGGGNDVLVGGLGNDLLAGSSGADSFRFNASNEGVDTILDMQINVDTIVLNDAGFSSLSTGALAGYSFRNGTAALDNNDFIIYDGTNLYYDSDGSGSAAQVHIATLSNGAAIDAADFLIV